MAEDKTFSWFPSMTRMVERVADNLPDKVGEFVMGIVNYGARGVEPEFSDMALMFAFEGLRGEIDHSINARYKNKGGRPTKADEEETPGKTPVSEKKTPVSEKKTPVPKRKTGVSASETGDTGSKTPFTVKQNNTRQDKTKQGGVLVPKNQNQNPAKGNAPSGAAAGRAQPLGAQGRCPKCGGKLWRNRQTGRRDCDSCFESFTAEQLAESPPWEPREEAVPW